MDAYLSTNDKEYYHKERMATVYIDGMEDQVVAKDSDKIK